MYSGRWHGETHPQWQELHLGLEIAALLVSGALVRPGSRRHGNTYPDGYLRYGQHQANVSGCSRSLAGPSFEIRWARQLVYVAGLGIRTFLRP